MSEEGPVMGLNNKLAPVKMPKVDPLRGMWTGVKA